jgi:flagellar hook-length control protein FliK
MTAPTTLLNLIAPPSAAAPAASAGNVRAQGADKSATPFSDVMARQRAAQKDNAAAAPKDTRGAQDGKPAPAAEDGKPAASADTDPDKQDDTDTTAAAAAGQPTLPQQALEMAAMMAQLQAAPAAAAAAAGNTATGDAADTTATAATAAAQLLPTLLSASGATEQTAAGDAPKATASDDKSGTALPAGFVAVAANANQTAADTSATVAAVAQQTVLPQTGTPTGAQTVPKTQNAQRGAAGVQAAGEIARAVDSGAPRADARTAANGGAGNGQRTDMQQLEEVHPAAARADSSVTAGDANAAQVSAAQNTLASALAASSQVPVSFRQAAPDAGLQVATPVGHAQWGDDLGRQMVVMSNNLQQNTHTAELRLDPPDLGPLRVTITLNEGVAQASFVSSHAAVRQAVESALPQLQQALSQAGISLGHTSVGDQGAQAGFASFNQGSGRQGQHGGQGDSRQGDTGAESAQVAVQARRVNDALVDTFA